MNILYITRLHGEKFAGPTYSVPRQIESQSNIDSVFWYNTCESTIREWRSINYYHDVTEYPSLNISDLPSPFNKPDLIVIEQFYDFFLTTIPHSVLKSKIPYVIIPRGELTKDAQKRKKTKKALANFVFMKRFARNASAIEYLTQQEAVDSTIKWNNAFFVIPNGIEIPVLQKHSFNSGIIKCVSIGRISVFHKGIDLLIGACIKIKEDIVANGVCFYFYGPDVDHDVPGLVKTIEKSGLKNNILFQDAVFGKEKERVLLESDVFIITSRFEGHPMALIEALSYGIPCLATKGSNMLEKVESYGAGFCADNEIDSIANAILRMIESRNQLPRLGENARHLSREFEWSKIASITHNAYKSLIEQ